MKISKSKRQLAQLLIEAGVTQFPEGANWAAQDGEDGRVFMYTDKPKREAGLRVWSSYGAHPESPIETDAQIPNWHQTALSRDEFDQIAAETVVQSEPQHCESVMRSIPEPTTAPTLDQLLQDWRNADDYAQRKQTEADEAAAMRDERWQAVQARAGEMGVMVGWRESGLVITDWRDLRVGDVVFVESMECDENEYSVAMVGRECVVVSDDPSYPVCLMNEFTPRGESYWLGGAGDEISWRFIRRP